MNKIFIVLTILGSLMVSVSGCAPMVSGAMNLTVTDDVVVEKTAKYFGTDQKNINVSQIEKGILATTYQTKYGGKFYNCRIHYGGVVCKQPGT